MTKINHKKIWEEINNSQLLGGFLPDWNQVKDDPQWLAWLEKTTEDVKTRWIFRGSNYDWFEADD